MSPAESERRPVGAQLKQLREARGWSQSDLARLSHVSQESIARLEAGEPGGQAPAVKRLAAALGVTPGMLLSVVEPKTTPPRKAPAARRKRK